MTDFLDLLPVRPDLLGFGEPTHGEVAFPRARNEAFAALAERGFRSIVLESDREAALIADAYVQGSSSVSLDRALAEGFSHSFGAEPGNRDLLEWMRDRNTGRPAAGRLTFHGFDGALEIEGTPSPRGYLTQVCEFLGVDRVAEIERLAGDDALWTDQAAIWEPGRSPGRSDDAVRLRAVADDLLTEMHLRAPRRADGWAAAMVRLSTAIGLLRYHAAAAEPLPREERFSRMAAVRDALMAENLLAIRAAEAHRGPTLVFANNRHLQRNPSRMTMAGVEVEWFCAGAIVGALMGERYAWIAGSVGSSPVLGLDEPAPGTFEGKLQRRSEVPFYLTSSDVESGAVREHDYRYFPLDEETVRDADLVLHIPAGG